MINMNGRDVWRLQVLGTQDRPSWSEEDKHAALAKAVGADVPYTILSTVPWARRNLWPTISVRAGAFWRAIPRTNFRPPAATA